MKPLPREAFLAGLEARIRHNREAVKSAFLLGTATERVHACPDRKLPTMKQFNPAETTEQTCYPDVMDRFLVQADTIEAMVAEARSACRRAFGSQTRAIICHQPRGQARWARARAMRVAAREKRSPSAN